MVAGAFRYAAMPDALPHLKAAFATDSLTWVDADFAWAGHLLLYDICPDRAEMLEATTCREPAAKIAALGSGGVLFTTGLSDRAALDLAAARIFPVVLEQRRSIHDTIARLQRLMRRDPPLWMCRMLRYRGQRHDR